MNPLGNIPAKPKLIPRNPQIGLTNLSKSDMDDSDPPSHIHTLPVSSHPEETPKTFSEVSKPNNEEKNCNKCDDSEQISPEVLKHFFQKLNAQLFQREDLSLLKSFYHRNPFVVILPPAKKSLRKAHAKTDKAKVMASLENYTTK